MYCGISHFNTFSTFSIFIFTFLLLLPRIVPPLSSTHIFLALYKNCIPLISLILSLPFYYSLLLFLFLSKHHPQMLLSSLCCGYWPQVKYSASKKDLSRYKEKKEGHPKTSIVMNCLFGPLTSHHG